jgi:mannose-6-phosphate isomerase-like protein (cupin superfamily)
VRNYVEPVVKKNWGHEQTVVNTADYCGKAIVVFPGMRNSFHYHRRKDETFLVLCGEVEVDYMPPEEVAEFAGWGLDESEVLEGHHKTCLLKRSESFRVVPGTRHRFVNRGDEPCIIIEFSTHHDDADVVRVIRGD